MPVTVQRTWYGDEAIRRARRACGRGVIAIGENISAKAKPLAPVEFGTLKRSIHTAAVNYDGSGDFAAAGGASPTGSDLQDTARVTKATPAGPVQLIEVGSWLPYACVQETRYHYMAHAVQEMQGSHRADEIMVEAFRQEGMELTPV